MTWEDDQGSLRPYVLGWVDGLFGGGVKGLALGSRLAQEARLLCPFDGPRPFETDFSGSLRDEAGGQLLSAAGGVIFRPGGTGKAVQMAQAGANLIPNPSFEQNVTDGWNLVQVSPAQASRQMISGGVYGRRAARISITRPGSYNWHIRLDSASAFSLAAGQVVTFSFYLRCASANPPEVRVYLVNDASTRSLSTACRPGADWRRFSCSGVIPAADAYRLSFRLGGAGCYDLEVDAVQLELLPYASPYCDGSLGVGHGWQGAAHASASSRAAAVLRGESAGVLEAAGGSIGLRLLGHTPPCDLFHAAAASGQIRLGVDAQGRLWGQWGSQALTGAALGAAGEERLLMTCQAGELRLYRGGALCASGPAGTPPEGLETAFSIGCSSSGTGQPNGLLDDLFVLGRALEEDEAACLAAWNGSLLAEPACPPFAAAQVARTASLTLPAGTWTAVAFNALNFDFTGAWAAHQSTRLTVLHSGLYLINAQGCFDPGTGGARGLALRLNGSTLSAQDLRPAAAPAAVSLSLTALRLLKAGDYLELLACHTNPADINLTAAELGLVRLR